MGLCVVVLHHILLLYWSCCDTVWNTTGGIKPRVILIVSCESNECHYAPVLVVSGRLVYSRAHQLFVSVVVCVLRGSLLDQHWLDVLFIFCAVKIVGSEVVEKEGGHLTATLTQTERRGQVVCCYLEEERRYFEGRTVTSSERRSTLMFLWIRRSQRYYRDTCFVRGTHKWIFFLFSSCVQYTLNSPTAYRSSS